MKSGLETQTGADAVCVALNADVYSGVRAITNACQQLESQFVVKKSTTFLSRNRQHFCQEIDNIRVLLVDGHRHHYGTSDFPTDENRYSSFSSI